jgi:hypothetical protein
LNSTPVILQSAPLIMQVTQDQSAACRDYDHYLPAEVEGISGRRYGAVDIPMRPRPDLRRGPCNRGATADSVVTDVAGGCRDGDERCGGREWFAQTGGQHGTLLIFGTGIRLRVKGVVYAVGLWRLTVDPESGDLIAQECHGNFDVLEPEILQTICSLLGLGTLDRDRRNADLLLRSRRHESNMCMQRRLSHMRESRDYAAVVWSTFW